MAYSKFSKIRNVHFAVKVTSITQDSFIFHHFVMFFYDNIFTTCYSTEDIAHFSSFNHRQYFKAIKYSLNCFNWIYFSYIYVGTKAFCSHSNAFTAPTVTSNDNVFTCYSQVCSTHDAIPNGLTCTIAIIKKIFTVRVVYCNHREC